ncbi:MAG: hypothetical protein F6K08_34150 [Okeania sp. SIO1H6]|nr:hypothetical protein [Okeania sp. SIO1H6]
MKGILRKNTKQLGLSSRKQFITLFSEKKHYPNTQPIKQNLPPLPKKNSDKTYVGRVSQRIFEWQLYK